MPTFPLHTYQAFQASVVQVVFARYDLLGLAPAVKWGTLNAAPTLCFARDHLGKERTSVEGFGKCR